MDYLHPSFYHELSGQSLLGQVGFHFAMKVTHRQVPGSIPGIEEGSTAIG